jgi:hypothetical protein
MRSSFMRPVLPLMTIALLNIISAAPGRGQASNTVPLQGAAPVGFNVLPNIPPNGFYAWCETPRGLCLVKGNAPIAPASVCHCAEYAGRTG